MGKGVKVVIRGSPGDVMYRMVTTVNNIVLLIYLKVTKRDLMRVFTTHTQREL